MVKVLIYSSKEIYDNATYEGRAEADFVAYRKDDGYYEITKNRTGRYLGSYCLPHTLNQEFEWMERDELIKELECAKNRAPEIKNSPVDINMNTL